jgi:hypothetical protein
VKARIPEETGRDAPGVIAEGIAGHQAKSDCAPRGTNVKFSEALLAFAIHGDTDRQKKRYISRSLPFAIDIRNTW